MHQDTVKQAAEARAIIDKQKANLPVVAKAAAPQFNLAPRNFAEAGEAAQRYARSSLVPQHFRGKPDDCFIMIQLAARQGIDPFMLMQHSYMVGGKPGMEGKYCIALMNARGPFKAGIQFDYEGDGDSRACTAWGIKRENGERCEARVDMAMVEAEGWIKNTKWTSMRDQMFAYRAGAFLARLYCPEVLMGMQTMEELEDIIDITPAQYHPVAPPPPPAPEPEPDTLLPAELDMHIKDMESAFQRGEGDEWWVANQKPIWARCTKEQKKRFYDRKEELKGAGASSGSSDNPPPSETYSVGVSKPRGRPRKPAEPSEKSQPDAEGEGRSEALLSLVKVMKEHHAHIGSVSGFYDAQFQRINQLSEEDRDWLQSEADALEGKG